MKISFKLEFFSQVYFSNSENIIKPLGLFPLILILIIARSKRT